MIFYLAKAAHCSPGRAAYLVLEAMWSFLVRTVVTQSLFRLPLNRALVLSFTCGFRQHLWISQAHCKLSQTVIYNREFCMIIRGADIQITNYTSCKPPANWLSKDQCHRTVVQRKNHWTSVKTFHTRYGFLIISHIVLTFCARIFSNISHVRCRIRMNVPLLQVQLKHTFSSRIVRHP